MNSLTNDLEYSSYFSELIYFFLKSPSPNPKRSSVRLWLRRLLIGVFLVITIPLALFTVSWFNRDTIINEIQEWYNENHNGTLSIGKVHSSFLSGFPKIGFTILDIEHTGLDTIADRKTSVYIKEAKITVGTRNLLIGVVKFEEIIIKDATIFSEVIPRRSIEYYKKLKIESLLEKQDSLKLHELFNNERVKFSLENITYASKDTTLNKDFDLFVHQLDGEFNGNEEAVAGNFTFDVLVNALGFNTAKGRFFKQSRVKGTSDFRFDIKNQHIEINQFPVAIDDQTFNLRSNFDVYGTTSYQFQLENNTTDYRAVKKLVSDSIAAKLSAYHIARPMETSLTLEGDFSYGNNPKIYATFHSEKNEIIIADKFKLKNAAFDGSLTTDIFQSDSLRSRKQSKKDFRLEIDNLTASVDSMQLVVKNSSYQSSQESLNYVDVSMQLEGENESLTRLIATDNFDFSGGNFRLNTETRGDIVRVEDLINSAIGDFYLENTRVALKRNGLQLPVRKIDLQLNNGSATLQQLTIQLPNGEGLTLRGTIKNPAGLVSNETIAETTSSINLFSEELNIDEIITTATQFLPESRTANADRKNLNETLEAIYNKFRPDFTIKIASLTYNGTNIQDFKGTAGLVDPETILVKNIDFTYHDVLTSFKGNITVPKAKNQLKSPIQVQVNATSNGPVQVFKELFNIELLDILSGTFNFEGKVSGNVYKFEELLQNARGSLNLTNNHYYYEPVDRFIKIDTMAVVVDNSDIQLNNFKIDLGQLKDVELSGSVKEFPYFLVNTKNEIGSIDLKVHIPYLDGDDLADMIASTNDTIEKKIKRDKKDLHSVFADINYFDPHIQLTIDSLKYKDLITKDVRASLQFKNDSTLMLDQFNIGYKMSQASIEGTILTSKKNVTSSLDNPFQFNFKINASGSSKDLNDYLKTTNFIFETGNFQFNASYKGQSDNFSLLKTETEGQLKLGPSTVYNEAADLRIPIDSLNVEIANNRATLNNLTVDLPGKSSIDLTGAIENFSGFIDNEITSNQNSRFKIHSSYLDVGDIKTFFSNTTKSEKKKPETKIDLSKFKEALLGINASFNPEIRIELDTLKIKKIDLTNVVSTLNFTPNGNFVLDKTSLQFLKSKAALNLEFGLQDDGMLPVNIALDVDELDINEFLSKMNYFEDEALKNAEKIEGTLTIGIKASGNVNNEATLDLSSLNGTVTLEISDLALFDYKPLLDAVILLKPERFEQLRFRPIVQTFKIVDGEIQIPRTEVQSSSIHLFVEGSLKLDEFVNVWIASPWSNLKSNDGRSLPEKTTFEDAGAKFYIQLLKDMDNPKPKKRDLKIKFRLSDRKLRKSKEE